MKKLTKLLFAFACILFLQNCTDDDFNTGNITNPETEAEVLRDEQFKSENFGNATTGNFIGIVKNIDGNILINVRITIGNTVTITDRNGIFILNDVDVFENFAYIKAQKDGYIDGSRVVIPKMNGVNKINIVLLKKEITATVSSGQASQVSLQNNGKVDFSGNFINTDGSPYNGQVEVVLHYVAPNSITTYTEMPGSLLAQNEANEARNLETYAMLSVNLFSPSGESLNIDENSPATITFPIHNTQTSIAPETINLWYFDEEVGYWKEDGQAVKNGNSYVAEVTHFTWWNCDIPFSAVEFCFSLSETNNITQQTPYYTLIKRNTNDQLIFSGIVTANDGLECGLIPQNEDVTVTIYGLAGTCYGQLMHEQTFGGYTTDTTIDISFSTTNQVSTTTITGIANNCAGNPITNGYVFIDEANTFSITDGTINIGVQHCDNQIITLQIFDFDTSQWLLAHNIPLNEVDFNLGTITTCEDTGGIYNGNLTLSSQEDVDNFGQLGFSAIDGNVVIGVNFPETTDIVDLTSLHTLENIYGSFDIFYNENLQSLDGLNNITTIDGFFYISNNNALTSLDGLASLTSVGNLAISVNETLTSIVGLSNLVTIGNGITIAANNSLTSIEGLESITSLRNLEIDYNDLLTSIAVMQNLTSLDQLHIEGNNALTSLVGLEQITALDIVRIADNNALMNLNGLENLVYLDPNTASPQVYIGLKFNGANVPPASAPNSSLTDFCALQNLFINGNGNNSNVEIFIANNGYNPTIQNIIDGNCSQ
ncbi:Internalin-A [Kordia antarctica]|uniref:Internalin-A n=1 Tax=Kordia antarctica TaxID=1218801 RepID=A0A7L4ZIF2_9FLAO|nr:hypothetical protein [Kordia antarctica]QHI35704.1 Internalin-A [Kordia antarctica]